MLDTIRTTAATAHRRQLDVESQRLAADGDLLAAIAWRSGSPELEPCDRDLRDLIDRARAARHTWPEISLASGHGADRVGAMRTMARQRQRHLH